MAVFFVFTNSFSKNSFNKKMLSLKIDSAASIRSHGKLTYFAYFPWPPLEEELSL